MCPDGSQHPKKSSGVLCERKPVKYAFILAELMAYPLSVICQMLGIPQSGFHSWRGRAPSARERERECLRASIRKVFEDHRGRYGAPRFYRVLRAQHGYTGSLKSHQGIDACHGACCQSRQEVQSNDRLWPFTAHRPQSA